MARKERLAGVIVLELWKGLMRGTSSGGFATPGESQRRVTKQRYSPKRIPKRWNSWKLVPTRAQFQAVVAGSGRPQT